MFALADFLIYCFVCAYTPGANNILSMTYASKLGFRRSFRFNLGITAGFLVVMSVCVIFSSTLYTLLPKIKILLQIAGGVYMIYLAWQIWKSSGNLAASENRESTFLSGILLQFINPKIYIYAITAMSLYILPVYQSPQALVIFTLVLTMIGASGSYVWGLFGMIFCKFFEKHAIVVIGVLALLLVYCAISLFF